ncbi:hypothetical protein OP10G_4049 [Fimbriimonas ginsengisoli Gsoil 348]|uniref:Uncharacterized protein n=1 Tax=Fimbriimonas ginsengisoli Gsoil 348 TaxID=661478 RepID=A0A068NVL3_FIMGI|nr:hypothetical protein OP10G_4049 [Fimbriimonas ginsengisoli Gsoil 348]
MLFAVQCLLIGCGGLEPCGGADSGTSNATYVGDYNGAFTITSVGAPGKNLTFDLSVDILGKVSGTVTEASTARSAAVSGTVIDWSHPCGTDATVLEANFQFTGEGNRTLSGTHRRGKPLTDPLSSSYRLLGPDNAQFLGNGNLVLTKK